MPDNNYKYVPTGLSNVKIVNIYGITTNGVETNALPSSNFGNVNYDRGVAYRYSDNSIVLQCNYNRTAENVYVTLKYTKDSDSANSFNIGSDTDYSTEEKIVGTWIDGKPLYQKTISIASTSTAWGVIYTVENGSNINIVQAKYYYGGSGVEWIKMNYTNGSDILLLATDANKIIMNGKGFTFGANNPVEMTIQYTKTTT